ncbi:MAG: EthD family reductase [Saprospiraceae bacterium]|nr:EthD family reductase [Saprospiraceae bacterium]
MKSRLLHSMILACCALTSYHLHSSGEQSPGTADMIKVTLMYPSGEGKTFDMSYYRDTHMPMVADLLGDALKTLSIDEGMGGRSPGEPAPYLAIGYLYFDALSEYEEAFGPHAEQIIGDIPNYTNSQPILQISKVVTEP